MEKLAEAIKLAVDIREGSWDNTIQDYNKTLYQACDKAAEIVGFDLRATTLISLLLSQTRNEALDWANKYK